MKDNEAISDWCAQFGQEKDFSEERFVPLVAVLCVALERCKKIYPRNVQIVTVLLAYPKEDRLSDRDGKRRKVFQVGTGEGKSVIVKLITAVERLYFGKCSDIVTSQNLLAERDAVDQSNFYDLALRSPSDFLDPCLPPTDTSRQEIYAKNPIYGTSFEYIGDMLRDEKYNVRNGRKQQTVIVDEVDNQLIDDILSSVRLSSPTAGLKEFNLLFMVIWNRLKLQLSSYGELVTIQQRMYSMKQDYTLCNVLNNMHNVQQTAGRDTCLSLLWMQLASSHFFRQHEEVAVKYGFTEQLRRDFSAVDAYMRQLLASDNLDIFNLLMFLSNPTMNLIKAKSKIALYRFVQRFEDGQAFQEPLGDHMGYDFVFLKQENQRPSRRHSECSKTI